MVRVRRWKYAAECRFSPQRQAKQWWFSGDTDAKTIVLFSSPGVGGVIGTGVGPGVVGDGLGGGVGTGVGAGGTRRECTSG